MSWSWELSNCYSEEFIDEFFSLTKDSVTLKQTIFKLEDLTENAIRNEVKRLKKLRKTRKKQSRKNKIGKKQAKKNKKTEPCKCLTNEETIQKLQDEKTELKNQMNDLQSKYAELESAISDLQQTDTLVTKLGSTY